MPEVPDSEEVSRFLFHARQMRTGGPDGPGVRREAFDPGRDKETGKLREAVSVSLRGGRPDAEVWKDGRAIGAAGDPPRPLAGRAVLSVAAVRGAGMEVQAKPLAPPDAPFPYPHHAWIVGWADPDAPDALVENEVKARALADAARLYVSQDEGKKRNRPHAGKKSHTATHERTSRKVDPTR